MSDAVFAFAWTLLVFADGPPRTFHDVWLILRDLPAFAACFASLLTIWYQHYLFFRRYGLEDLLTIFTAGGPVPSGVSYAPFAGCDARVRYFTTPSRRVIHPSAPARQDRMPIACRLMENPLTSKEPTMPSKARTTLSSSPRRPDGQSARRISANTVVVYRLNSPNAWYTYYLYVVS